MTRPFCSYLLIIWLLYTFLCFFFICIFLLNDYYTPLFASSSYVSSYYMIIIHLSLLLLHLGIMDPFLYSKHSAICIWRAPFVSLFILFGLCMNKNTRVEWFCQIDCQNNYNKLQINNWTRSFDPTIPIWLLSCENTVSELSLSYRQSFPDASTSFST